MDLATRKLREVNQARVAGIFCHYRVGGENKTARDVEGKQSGEK